MKYLAAWLLLCSSVLAQTVTMPQAVVVVPYRLAPVEISFDGDDFAWQVPPELEAFREYGTDPNVVKLRVQYVPPKDSPNAARTFTIIAVATKAVDGKAKLSKFQTCLVHVNGPVPPDVVTPPDTPTIPPVPPVDPTTKPTAATYIYEKDDTGSVPAPVASAINKLNLEKKIIATIFEEDTTEIGTGQTPRQYKAALDAARAAGLPALVVTAGDKVMRVVKAPKTEQEVLEAIAP